MASRCLIWHELGFGGVLLGVKSRPGSKAGEDDADGQMIVPAIRAKVNRNN